MKTSTVLKMVTRHAPEPAPIPPHVATEQAMTRLRERDAALLHRQLQLEAEGAHASAAPVAARAARAQAMLDGLPAPDPSAPRSRDAGDELRAIVDERETIKAALALAEKRWGEQHVEYQTAVLAARWDEWIATVWARAEATAKLIHTIELQ